MQLPKWIEPVTQWILKRIIDPTPTIRKRRAPRPSPNLIKRFIAARIREWVRRRLTFSDAGLRVVGGDGVGTDVVGCAEEGGCVCGGLRHV